MSPEEAADPGIKANTRSTKEPLAILYGQLTIGGNDVFMGTSNDGLVLWIVQSIGEGEYDSIVKRNGAGDIDASGTEQVFLGDQLYNEYGGYVTYAFYGGTSTQTYDPSLNSFISEWTDNLRYTAYIIWRLSYNKDYFMGVPERTVEMKGRKLYDFRDLSTAYSNNPVLCLYDYLTNTRFGLSISSSAIDTTSWTSAANYCDTKGWTYNRYLRQDTAAIDVVNDMKRHFRGTLVWWDGKFYLRYADLNYESSSMTLEDKHIVRDDSGKAMIEVIAPSRFDTHDGFRVSFIDAEKQYTEDSIQIGESSGNIGDISFPGCTDREMACNLATYYLEKEQIPRKIRGVFRDDAVQLESHDVVTLTSSALHITDQIMRVEESNTQPNGLVELTLGYEAVALYNDDYDIVPEDVYKTDLPDPKDEPPSLRNVTVTEELYSYRGKRYTRLQVDFNDVNDYYPWFDHVEVWGGIGAEGEVGPAFAHLLDTAGAFTIDPAHEKVSGKRAVYYLRFHVVSIWERRQGDATAYRRYHTVTGASATAPESLSALYTSVNGNAINLYADPVDDPDVDTYEFRMGDTWNSAVFLSSQKAPNLSLTGVKPPRASETHTFWCNTKGCNTIYGDTPVSASVSLENPPPSWYLHGTRPDPNFDGVHSGTEVISYLGENYLLRASQSITVTPTYSYLSIVKIADFFGLVSQSWLVWVDADIVITGYGSTWADIFADATTWAQINSTRTWADIIGGMGSCPISMVLLYSDSYGGPYSEVKNMEIVSTYVKGLYFKLRIELTDPSDSVRVMVQNYTLNFCDPYP